MSLLFQLSSTSAFPKQLLWETVEWWHRVWKKVFKSRWEGVPSLMLMAVWNQCSPGCAGNSFSWLQSQVSSKAHFQRWLSCTVVRPGSHIASGQSPPPPSPPCRHPTSAAFLSPTRALSPNYRTLALNQLASPPAELFPLSRLPFHLLYGQNTPFFRVYDTRQSCRIRWNFSKIRHLIFHILFFRLTGEV